ncbi:Inositol monophosphatase 1 [Seminavis robusta]|uniref:Inositol-1-monophosphatase n=1 Tax=Seminavis robusta TaxID=568900 RepID=A0A9N8D729_9STRA|nr:Inositol monophosphatase 1 [Seminavis robusta]|eukprot:Sro21_g014880.1 Inositol monophosphatase 1 (294) ;mRNA; r:127281-128162
MSDTTASATDLSLVLSVAQEAARLAGSTIVGALGSAGALQEKSNSTDLVTETDQKCEELIVKLLQEKFPAHKIIGEESNGSAKYELTDDPTWTIDPIDGTTNFVHSLKLSCVILSFLEQKIVQVAVVYDPYHDELFYATKGQGAFLIAKGGAPTPLQVSQTKSLKQAVITMDPGYGRGSVEVARFCNLQAAILQTGVRNLRILGSTGLVMANVAAGRVDAAFEEGSWDTGLGPKIWDFAAGKLLIQEAGGLTRDIEASDFSNTELDVMKRSFFGAATPELANELLAIIAKDKK